MMFVLSAGIFAQNIINVNPHTDPNGTNYAKIKKVTLYRPYNGQTIVQTSEKTGVVGANDQYPVHIVGVEAYTPGSNQGSVITLDYFNFEGVEIRNMNLNSSNSGVGVYENGLTYPANSNFSAFEQKLEEYLLDANMRSMSITMEQPIFHAIHYRQAVLLKISTFSLPMLLRALITYWLLRNMAIHNLRSSPLMPMAMPLATSFATDVAVEVPIRNGIGIRAMPMPPTTLHRRKHSPLSRFLYSMLASLFTV